MIERLLKPTPMKKFLFFLLSDVFLCLLVLYISFLFRFEFAIPNQQMSTMFFWMPIMLIIKIFLFNAFSMYKFSWNFVGLRELISIGYACFLASVCIFFFDIGIYHLAGSLFLPRSIIFIDFVLTVLVISNLRVGKRLYQEVIRRPNQGMRTLIIGAGPTGERLVREFFRSAENGYNPLCFVDDDPNKQGTFIHGIRVVGTIDHIPEIVREYRIEAAIIAITTAKHVFIMRLFDLLHEAGVRTIKVFPHLSQLPDSSINIKSIHDIRLEDLLSREAVNINISAIREYLTAHTVLVTGGAGSIGSEIVRQVLTYHPKKLILFDIDESEVFNLMLELKPKTHLSTTLIPYVGDVRREESLRKLFFTHKPDVVFHAAAYKHVPMMELFPGEALSTNIIGTYNLAQYAVRYHTKRFINISTDKAVKPSSVMGATKRLAEMICTTFNQKNGTAFVSVRFGNVLGSRGSVVPIFLKQIQDGGPITVTHPEVKRYFMTIPEAVSLVFQAASMGHGGEVFVLDMGEPVRIVTLAETLIRLNGMEPYHDIPIEFVGLRPGEKLFEELLTAEEGTSSTTHEKIFMARNITRFEERELPELIRSLHALEAEDIETINRFLTEQVPYYKSHQESAKAQIPKDIPTRQPTG